MSARLPSERLAALVKRREDMEETQRGLEEKITLVLAGFEDVRAVCPRAPIAPQLRREERDGADTAMSAERAEREQSEREHSRLLSQVTDRERQIADASRRKACSSSAPKPTPPSRSALPRPTPSGNRGGQIGCRTVPNLTRLARTPMSAWG